MATCLRWNALPAACTRRRLAVDDTQVCTISYTPLVTLMASDSALQHRVGQLMRRELTPGHRQWLLLGRTTAQQRLAEFLLNLSQHFGARGDSPLDIQLRVSHAEIGSYLGLTLETVSRTFGYFQDQGLLPVHHRSVRLVALPQLSSRSQCCERCRRRLSAAAEAGDGGFATGNGVRQLHALCAPADGRLRQNSTN
jgi:Crp-like helix-turn-helix domain